MFGVEKRDRGKCQNDRNENSEDQDKIRSTAKFFVSRAFGVSAHKDRATRRRDRDHDREDQLKNGEISEVHFGDWLLALLAFICVHSRLFFRHFLPTATAQFQLILLIDRAEKLSMR